MKDYIKVDEWCIIEEAFQPENNMITESLCSIGNARLGQRANFEEGYSGESLPGSYIAGIYYPDKTRVGWWKNGYPEYFAKVLNSVNWIGIDIHLNDEKLDLNKAQVLSFNRQLDMQKGLLSRSCELAMSNGCRIQINAERFYSFQRQNIGILKYQIKILSGAGTIKICPSLDFDVKNKDSNYDDVFWKAQSSHAHSDYIYVEATTKKTNFKVGAASQSHLTKNGTKLEAISKVYSDSKSYQAFETTFNEHDEFELIKTACIQSSFYVSSDDIQTSSIKELNDTAALSYNELRQEQIDLWAGKWKKSDIKIDGDKSAQQGIRFNIFHLNQTYDGNDPRLNIGPKGFTGEKYGGSTYWDTEAYCLPFYLFTADKEVARNLLMYRYHHLNKAIENAINLGFNSGAALYPMVTMNGEECHNEWEITFEEIHRNGAIAYAIYDYTNHFNDREYLESHGFEVLIAISRFWAQRVQYSQAKNKYVMLGVTGPNEYENNVNNNWYTNYIAQWCLKYTISELLQTEQTNLDTFNAIVKKTGITELEKETWSNIIDQMYLPYNEEKNIYLQQDGFLDKDLTPVNQIDKKHLPLNQKWSWDRILRSAYIKQADTLQGFYFFEDDFDRTALKKHFDFYEPLTVHESSLSPCVHAILASKLNMLDKAYEMYLRTARLDIDDYNNDTEDGLHITSMAGTWMAIVKGFAGARVKSGVLHLNPLIPKNWNSISFSTLSDGQLLSFEITNDIINIANNGDKKIHLKVKNIGYEIDPNESKTINL